MTDIVFCGGIFTDFCTYTPRFPEDGETVFGRKFETGFGGKASNQAVMCAKLGSSSVVMLGKLGDDANGKSYLKNYEANGVDSSRIVIDGRSCSGIASIWINTASGENKIVIVPGVNATFNRADVQPARDVFKRAKAVGFALEANEEGILAAMEMAKEFGAKIVTNAAPAKADLNPDIFKFTDILCVNENEAQLVAGRAEKLETDSDVDEALNWLLTKCHTVIITLGAKGAVLATRDDMKPRRFSAPEVKVIDTTGAGDAFVGAFIYLHFELNIGLDESVRRASHIASFTVEREGTQASYPSREQLPSLLFEK